MFGMLDYRAHKLLWLICLPIRLVIWIVAWGAIAIAVMISASLDYSVLVRIVIAYAIWEGAAFVLRIVSWVLFRFIAKGFFWLIDVVPAKAENVTEAKVMAMVGPAEWLGKKLLTDIGNWRGDNFAGSFRKIVKSKAQNRWTLTPLILVRIQVPQPIEIT
jgi:hypothetical protein